jgi:hypothetical protein
LIQKSPSLKVKVEGLFQENADFKLGSKVHLICDQLRNPIGLNPSGSFAVEVSNPVAASKLVSDGMSIQMVKVETLT